MEMFTFAPMYVCMYVCVLYNYKNVLLRRLQLCVCHNCFSTFVVYIFIISRELAKELGK